jgi:hypothetical protein
MCLRRAPEKYIAGAALDRAGLGALTCIPSFIEVCSEIQKLVRGFTDTKTAW